MHHPTLNIEKWKSALRLPEGIAQRDALVGDYRVSGPAKLALCERIREDVLKSRDLGYSVPSDVFVWSTTQAGPDYLTRIGGSPFMPHSMSWPVDSSGQPLFFIGQICFADSHDFMPALLHDKTMLLFAPWTPWAKADLNPQWLDYSNAVWVLVDIKTTSVWESNRCPEHSMLGFQFFGVRHRTANYPQARSRLSRIGFARSDWCLAQYGATQISSIAFFQQGDPWGMGLKKLEALTAQQFAALPKQLVASLDSVYMDEQWPFVDVARRDQLPTSVPRKPVSNHVFCIEDAGTLYVGVSGGRDEVWVGSG